MMVLTFGAIALAFAAAHAQGAPAATKTALVTAIVGATVIDGAGAPPQPDATVLIQDRHIQAVGPRSKVQVPANAEVIDGHGLFVVPGFIDAGAPLSSPEPYLPWDTTYTSEEGEPTYDPASIETTIAQRAAQALTFGVTTVRARGALHPLRTVRDRIRARGMAGPRLLITGYTVGGFELGTEIPLDSLRPRLTQYLDAGIDFIKYAGTTIVLPEDGTPAREYTAGPPLMVFGEETQHAIITVAHERGVSVEAHANSPEGLRTILEAGVDLVQHPEMMLNNYLLPDDLVRLFVQQHVICGLIPTVSAASPGRHAWSNAQRLIRQGCPVAVISGAQPGAETLHAIEALVTLGMTPMQALVAGTHNGALACKRLDDFGTIEAGKLADLVVLRADPLQDIHNIEQVVTVFAEGIRIPMSAGAGTKGAGRAP